MTEKDQLAMLAKLPRFCMRMDGKAWPSEDGAWVRFGDVIEAVQAAMPTQVPTADEWLTATGRTLEAGCTEVQLNLLRIGYNAALATRQPAAPASTTTDKTPAGMLSTVCPFCENGFAFEMPTPPAPQPQVPFIGRCGGAMERFNEWFCSENFDGLPVREIASLGFDAGHSFWHSSVELSKTEQASFVNGVQFAQAQQVQPAEDVQRDAERYRWLREQDNEDFCFAVVKNPHFDVYEPGAELDTAIDAAQAEGGR